jgi:hypothetical protein
MLLYKDGAALAEVDRLLQGKTRYISDMSAHKSVKLRRDVMQLLVTDVTRRANITSDEWVTLPGEGLEGFTIRLYQDGAPPAEVDRLL